MIPFVVDLAYRSRPKDPQSVRWLGYAESVTIPEFQSEIRGLET